MNDETMNMLYDVLENIDKDCSVYQDFSDWLASVDENESVEN